jgi:hypothetical protein
MPLFVAPSDCDSLGQRQPGIVGTILADSPARLSDF